MREVKIKYFYKGEEINIEKYQELIKKYNHLPFKQEMKGDEINIFIQDPIDYILMDECTIFPQHFFGANWRQTKLNQENFSFPKKQSINNQYGKISFETYKEKGVKYNDNKPKLSMLFIQFPDALKAIVKCSEYGHEKYKEFDKDFLNFKKVEGGSKAFADSGLRHRIEKGLDESGLPHQYHVAWNALAELQMWIEEQNNLKNK